MDAAFDLREHLETANHCQGRERLGNCSPPMRPSTRCVSICGWPPVGAGFGRRYQHVAAMVSEIGRLFGGWRKVTRARPDGQGNSQPMAVAIGRRVAGVCLLTTPGVAGRAFNNNRRNARCAYRNRNNPDNRNDNIGFRVVVSTFFSAAGNAARGGAAIRAEAKNGRACPGRVPGGSATGPGPITTALRPGSSWRRASGFQQGSVPHVTARLCSWENLLLAYRRPAWQRGQPNVAAFEYRLEDNLLHCRRNSKATPTAPVPTIASTSTSPSAADLGGAVSRPRRAPRALQPYRTDLRGQFHRRHYANRVGKGTHRALNRCHQFARDFPFVLTMRRAAVLPRLDHAILFDILARRILDPAAPAGGTDSRQRLGVLSEEYAMAWFPGDDLFAAARPRGLPIGNLTSPALGQLLPQRLRSFRKTRTPVPRPTSVTWMTSSSVRRQQGRALALERRRRRAPRRACA